MVPPIVCRARGARQGAPVVVVALPARDSPSPAFSAIVLGLVIRLGICGSLAGRSRRVATARARSWALPDRAELHAAAHRHVGDAVRLPDGHVAGAALVALVERQEVGLAVEALAEAEGIVVDELLASPPAWSSPSLPGCR